MQTFAMIIGVLTVVGWVADQTLGDVRAILRSERRRRR
jgi:dipeptide/tripeptide permease